MNSKTSLKSLDAVGQFEALNSAARQVSSVDLDELLLERNILSLDLYSAALQTRAEYMLDRGMLDELVDWAKDNAHDLKLIFGEAFIFSLLSVSNEDLSDDGTSDFMRDRINCLVRALKSKDDLNAVKHSFSVWVDSNLCYASLWPIFELLSEMGVEIPVDGENSTHVILLSHNKKESSFCIDDFKAYGLSLPKKRETLLPLVLELIFDFRTAEVTPLEYMQQAPSWQHPFILPFMNREYKGSQEYD